MEDFNTLLQQIVEQCLNELADPAEMVLALRDMADIIDADIESGAYAE